MILSTMHTHPHLLQWLSSWIEFIQREEAVTKAKILSFRVGATAWPQRHRMKEKRIETRFDAGDISLNEHLGAIKHLTRL